MSETSDSLDDTKTRLGVSKIDCFRKPSNKNGSFRRFSWNQMPHKILKVQSYTRSPRTNINVLTTMMDGVQDIHCRSCIHLTMWIRIFGSIDLVAFLARFSHQINAKIVTKIGQLFREVELILNEQSNWKISYEGPAIDGALVRYAHISIFGQVD